jgi:hypothetical protein
MKLIFISGMPAAGKLTVARELHKLTGLRLFHNHLTVDLLLEIFEFGSPEFVNLREAIWLSVFDHACRAKLPGLIFTFNAENTVRQEFISKTIQTIESHAGELIFIELVCNTDELKKRLADPARAQFGKLTSVQKFEELNAADVFSSPKLPVPKLSIDTGLHAPAEAAHLIAQACGWRK